jgi:hypothetical protein
MSELYQIRLIETVHFTRLNAVIITEKDPANSVRILCKSNFMSLSTRDNTTPTPATEPSNIAVIMAPTMTAGLFANQPYLAIVTANVFMEMNGIFNSAPRRTSSRTFPFQRFGENQLDI